jgi:hypothetical protein
MKLTLPSGATGFYDEQNKWISTGSQMGRRNQLPDDTSEPVKLRLTRLPFVDGCYDRWGAYWGSPANVWCAWVDASEFQVRVFVRANDRETAKAGVRAVLPNAKFYR